MTLTFTIPAAKLSRISAALDFYGYQFDSTLGINDTNQRINFFENITIADWQSLLFNYERNLAINTVGDSAALQVKRFIGLSDVTATSV